MREGRAWAEVEYFDRNRKYFECERRSFSVEGVSDGHGTKRSFLVDFKLPNACHQNVLVVACFSESSSSRSCLGSALKEINL